MQDKPHYYNVTGVAYVA